MTTDSIVARRQEMADAFAADETFTPAQAEKLANAIIGVTEPLATRADLEGLRVEMSTELRELQREMRAGFDGLLGLRLLVMFQSALLVAILGGGAAAVAGLVGG